MITEMKLRNTASCDKKRKVFSSFIVNRLKGYTSVTEKKYVYIIRRIKNREMDLTEKPTQVYVSNAVDTKKASRNFRCLLKGSFLLNTAGEKFLVKYAHSMQISLTPQ